MADFEATGDELQKLVRLGKKRPMPFAFCPSSGGSDDALFATHRTKPPEVIAKAARKESGQTKVAFGTFTVDAKLMTLIVIKELPAIAKKLKKHLRHERLYLNVKIVDVMGTELDADIEDLPEDSTLDGDEPDDDSDDVAEWSNIADDGKDEDLPDPKALVQRLKDMQPGIMALQGDAGDKLRAALSGAIGLIKAGQLVRAESMITAIDRVFARQPMGASPRDPEVLAAGLRLKNLRGQVTLLEGPTTEKLLAALGLVAQQILAGDAAKAAQTMDAVDHAIARSKAAQPQAVPERLDEDPTDPMPENPDAARKWAEVAERLEPLVLATLRAGKGDIDAIKRHFFSMQDQAMAGKHAAALAAAPGLAALIRAAQAATQSQADAAIPSDVVPFVQSRLAWVNTRAQLRAEVETLKSAMDRVLSGIEGMEESVAETAKLFTYLEALDTRLETILEALVQTPDGSERAALKAKARAVIADYNTTLDGDFFRDVDGDNGFAPVKIRAPAIAALQQVSNALAA